MQHSDVQRRAVAPEAHCQSVVHVPTRQFIPPLTSLVVHLVAFIALALVVATRWSDSQLQLSLVVSAPVEAEQLRGSPLNSPLGVQFDTTESATDDAAALPDLLPIPSPLEPVTVTSVAPAERYATQALDQVARNFPRPSANQELATRARLSEATDAGQALGGVLGEIEGRLAEQDLLVVWLFDASLSLNADRRLIADRLRQFFAEHEGPADARQPLLMNAAVAFGTSPVEVEPATRSGKRIVEAIGRLPNDTSGIENVFTAIKWAVERYHRRKGHLMLVVWTDESGDDAHHLEAVIQTCTRYKVSVSVVGPTSILGRIYGRQVYVIGGRGLLLPVSRGPDTPVSERLQLPYWFDTVFPAWGEGGGALLSHLPGW